MINASQTRSARVSEVDFCIAVALVNGDKTETRGANRPKSIRATKSSKVDARKKTTNRSISLDSRFAAHGWTG